MPFSRPRAGKLHLYVEFGKAWEEEMRKVREEKAEASPMVYRTPAYNEVVAVWSGIGS